MCVSRTDKITPTDRALCECGESVSLKLYLDAAEAIRDSRCRLLLDSGTKYMFSKYINIFVLRDRRSQIFTQRRLARGTCVCFYLLFDCMTLHDAVHSDCLVHLFVGVTSFLLAPD